MLHNIEKDLARYKKLHSGGHMSPFEHAAKAARGKVEFGPPFEKRWKLREGVDRETRSRYGTLPDDAWEFDGYFCGNFRAPWIQHRKMLPGEAVFGG